MFRLDSTELRCYSNGSVLAAICAASLLLVSGCAGLTSDKPGPGVTSYRETGIASYYASRFQNRKTANGERFDNNAMTAAHKTLPFGTQVIVKNVNNGKSVKVRINDRGPFVKGRIIDLTRAAFAQIADPHAGLTRVEIMVVKQM